MKQSSFNQKKLINMDDLRRLKDSPMWNQGKTDGVYRFPLPTDRDFLESGAKLAIGVPEDELYHIGPYYAAKNPESHISPFKWAVDFLVPDGTDILAADEGQIVEAIDNFMSIPRNTILLFGKLFGKIFNKI